MNIKKINTIPLISILLRLEVGLPFVLFSFPLNLVIGIGFAIVNYFSENQYLNAVILRQRVFGLAKTCLFCALLLILGWIVHCNFTYLSNGERKIDYFNIYVVTLLCALIPLCMMFCRLILCLVDAWTRPPNIWSKKEFIDTD